MVLAGTRLPARTK